MRDQSREILLNYGGIKWQPSQLVYADDTVLYAKSEMELGTMVGHCDDACYRNLLKVSASMRKFFDFGRDIQLYVTSF